MPNTYVETNFDEKSGYIPMPTKWGQWWQTVNEVHIEIDVKLGTPAREIKVKVKPQHILVEVQNEKIIEGNLFSIVNTDEVLWTLEDKKTLNIVLVKADALIRESVWESLLKDKYVADPLTFHEMKKKHDLEKFQIENPGFDFSTAKLAKCYDKPQKKFVPEEPS